MTTEEWPARIYPIRQSYYIQTESGLFGGLNGQLLSFARDGAKWVATLDLRLSENKAAIFDALLSKLNGPTGKLMVPDFRRVKVRAVTESMDDYAARIGITFFNDHYDFSDQTEEEGVLTTEGPVPLGTEKNMLLAFDFLTAFLIFPDEVMLETELGEDLLGENVGIPFASEDEQTIVTVDFGAPLEIGTEEGAIFDIFTGEQIAAQIGGGFFEGTGQPYLVGGAYNKISVDGLAPFLNEIVFSGETIQTSPGRAHIILFDTGTDINGRGQIFVAPHIRESIVHQILKMGGTKVVMRLVDDNAAQNETETPFITTYQLRLEEILP